MFKDINLFIKIPIILFIFQNVIDRYIYKIGDLPYIILTSIEFIFIIIGFMLQKRKK